jgi:chromosomal replication initiation ATPase DnaA
MSERNATTGNGKSEARKEFERRLIADLRRDWNAPKGNAGFIPCYTGVWGNAWERLRAGLEKPGRVYAILGPSSTGKTQLAVEAMRLFTAQLRRAYYLTAMEFLLRVKATYRKDSLDTEQDVVNDLRRPSLIVLDEFTKRGESDWENRLLFHVVNSRLRDGRDTIIVSNQSYPEFSAWAEPSLVARLNRSGLIVANWAPFAGDEGA